MSEEKSPLTEIIEGIGQAWEDFCEWLLGLFSPKQPEQEETPPDAEEPTVPEVKTVEEVEQRPTNPTEPARPTATADGREIPRDVRG